MEVKEADFAQWEEELSGKSWKATCPWNIALSATAGVEADRQTSFNYITQGKVGTD